MLSCSCIMTDVSKPLHQPHSSGGLQACQALHVCGAAQLRAAQQPGRDLVVIQPKLWVILKGVGHLPARQKHAGCIASPLQLYSILGALVAHIKC